MSTIKVSCNDQVMSFDDMPVIASGGVNEDQVQFSFDSAWNLYAKTAVFYRNPQQVYHVPITENRCNIPHEVLEKEGDMYFGVFGIHGTTIQTSEVVKYKIVQGAITEGITVPPPSGGGSGDYDEIYADIIAIKRKRIQLMLHTLFTYSYKLSCIRFSPFHIFFCVQDSSGALQNASVSGRPKGRKTAQQRYRLPVEI